MTQSSLSEQATTVPLDKEPNSGDTAALVSRPPIVDYAILLKPRVMSLVLFTGFTGMLLAPGNIDVLTGAIAVICIALGAGASGAINLWYDRDIDALMARTRNRPIPARFLPLKLTLMRMAKPSSQSQLSPDSSTRCNAAPRLAKVDGKLSPVSRTCPAMVEYSRSSRHRTDGTFFTAASS